MFAPSWQQTMWIEQHCVVPSGQAAVLGPVRGAAAACAAPATSSPAAPAAARTGNSPLDSRSSHSDTRLHFRGRSRMLLGNARLAVTARRADIAASITAGGPTAAGFRGRRAAACRPQDHEDSDTTRGNALQLRNIPSVPLSNSSVPTPGRFQSIPKQAQQTILARTAQAANRRVARDACCPPVYVGPRRHRLAL